MRLESVRTWKRALVVSGIWWLMYCLTVAPLVLARYVLNWGEIFGRVMTPTLFVLPVIAAIAHGSGKVLIAMVLLMFAPVIGLMLAIMASDLMGLLFK